MMRLATTEDLKTVVALTAAAYQPYTDLYGYPPIPVTEDYMPRIASGEVWLRDLLGEIVGFVVVERHLDHLLLFSIAVRPGLQHSGHGRAMLAWLDDKALQWGLPEIRLYTNARMERNIAVYSALGFQETGRRQNPHRPGWTIVDMAKQVEVAQQP
jgi:ribosomal protein S18 acetylase RimI-like enzyme